MISIATRGLAHQTSWGERLAQGVRAAGMEPLSIDAGTPATTKVVACWGWRVGQEYRAAGHEVLMAERGFVGDRFAWTSLGWNGLNGKADFNLPVVADEARWREHFADLMKPWRDNPAGYVLLMGQVPSDTSVRAVDHIGWLRQTAAQIKRQGLEVRFRPHPQATGAPVGLPEMGGTLDDALAGAAVVVTYNSNSGVDAVLAGVPTVVVDRGGMAWPVATHDTGALVLAKPARKRWAANLAWCQWTDEEIVDGTAWAYVGRGRTCA